MSSLKSNAPTFAAYDKRAQHWRHAITKANLRVEQNLFQERQN
ncbi:6872_t:CDS:2 [Paraglomus brasilianum]|uniref:6872_t:CDS:1 n=1 Tax=Paraglomus brasilianum TaxID=144538 RepID=A0A9N8VX08_9GLOM|nr:6872_t:CDS:2 [Paraglomus brasilianum]